MKSVAILQSSYIPWKGYVDIIHCVDGFVWYDNVQNINNNWRNRNRLITTNGVQCLTVPCSGKGVLLINMVQLNNSKWQEKHQNSLQSILKSTILHALSRVL